MAEKRIGRQTPTVSVVCNYSNTYGQEVIDSYNLSGNELMPYQCNSLYDMMAYGDDGLWTHSTQGFQISRRNGKGEILTAREIWGLEHGENILHTAHRADTSSDASYRLYNLLIKKGMTEVLRPRADQEYPGQFKYDRQKGMEKITFLWGEKPSVNFRTRTGSGGLGQGYDVLIIDEAQEYTDEQATSLAFITSASKNPVTIMCGTPPTIVSKGTVFTEYRTKCLSGSTDNSLWFSWETEKWTDPNDKDAWYEYNPALGITITERAIKDEIAKTSADDFNIQRFGLWIAYNQKSEISKAHWDELKVSKLPALTGKLSVGIKFSKNGSNVAMAIGVKTNDSRIYTEVIDCRPLSSGYDWIISFIRQIDYQTVAIDGANGQMLIDDMKDSGIKKPPIFMKVSEVVQANAEFKQGLGDDDTEAMLCHSGQPSVDAVATNCERRAIGNNGGFGYKSINDDAEIALLDCTIIAFWLAKNAKEKRKHTFVC